MAKEGAHCGVCGIGLIEGGHCNNSKCLKSPFYTPGGRKTTGTGPRRGPKPKSNWVVNGLILAAILIGIAMLLD